MSLLNKATMGFINILLVSLILATSHARSTSNITIPTAFRQVGVLCSDAGYGHIMTSFNITHFKWLIEQAKLSANISLAAIEIQRGRDITLSMTPFYNSLQLSLEPSERLMEQLDIVFQEEDSRSARSERQLLLGATMLTSGLGLGLSILNTIQIQNLKNEVEKEKETQQHIITLLQQEEKSIETLSNSVITLNTTMVKLATEYSRISNKFDLLTGYSLLHNKFETFNQEMVLTFEGLMSLTKGTLSPTLVNKQQLISSIRELNKRAQKTGLHLLHSELSYVFKAEISYIVQRSIIYCFVHLPLVRRDSLALYEYLSVPFYHGNPENSPLLTASSPDGATFLAIDTDGKKGLSLTHSFLAGCHRENNARGITYICPDDGNVILNDVSSESCLGLLYSSNYEQNLLLQKCKIEFVNSPEFCKQIGPGSFILFTKNPTKLTIICPLTSNNQMDTNVTMITGMQRLDLKPGCFAYTIKYSMTGNFDLYSEGSFLYMPKPLELDHNIFPVTKLIDFYKELSKVSVPERIDARLLQSLKETTEWRSTSTITGGSLATLALVITFGILAYLAYTIIRYRLANRVVTRANRQGMDHEMDQLANHAH